MKKDKVLTQLLDIELQSNASKLGFIEKIDFSISNNLLQEAISVLNKLSVNRDEESKKYLIAICALLWTYKDEKWDGLKDYLTLFLSRSGFGPSSIMIDKEYDSADSTFSQGSSLINMFSITLSHLEHEISISDKTFLISEFQKSIWNGIEKSKVIGVSAPTSAGKSFLILLKAIDLIIKKSGSIIYVVPTLSLVSQVQSDFRKILDEFSLDEYSLETAFNGQYNNEKAIFVLTQEKAISAFSQKNTPFPKLRLLVIDEIQNVERVEDSDDNRAKVLYDLMIELKNTSIIDHIIISGPRIENIDKLGMQIFGEETMLTETNASPVLNLTYSLSKIKKESFLNLHFELSEQPIKLKIEDTSDIVFRGSMYNDKYLTFLHKFLATFNEEESNIIFSPTSNTCTTIANFISAKTISDESQYLNGLSEFIASTIHRNYPMVQSVKKSIVYHHGKLPIHIRLVIEHAIKQKQIKTIICTTTLLQGVNLPVQNIIIRNPNLYTRKKSYSTKLTNYEVSNLRGRAGRLLKDFVGRTYILDENGFNQSDSNQMELFKDDSKDIKVGYGSKYNQYKNAIFNDITEGIGSNENNKEYSFLNTYLRQTIIRQGEKSIEYLKSVGIILETKVFKEFQTAINGLEVPKAICSNNRYWDPVDLNRLFIMASEIDIPTDPNVNNLSSKLKEVILFIKEHFPIYYDRYFSVPEVEGRDMILSKCYLIEKWIREKPLFDFFTNSYYDDPANIEKDISFIQNKVSYGLPLMIKPLYDIKSPDSLFTRFIEMGAYTPITRKLIDLNIPRETAIFLKKNYPIENIEDRKLMTKQVRELRKELPYWYKIQLELI
jgi:replicative superfamily II helicase